MAQSSVGRIRIFDDFIGFEVPVASTAAPATAPYFTPGGLRVVGQGLADTDSGVVCLDADGLNGVVRLTTTNETEHSAGFTTNSSFDMALNGGIGIEARVRFENTDTKQVYFGLTDVVTDGVGILEGEQMVGSGTAITLTASDLCGFMMTPDLTTDPADWHGVYNGGTTTGETTSTSINFSDDAGTDFQVLRLEVDSNGTARWYIDGDLKQTVTGAVSTSTDLAVLLMVEAKGNAIETMDVDYVLIETNRDWTA